MASSKNSNNSNSTNEMGGFKTAAFGFDKNDVTLYIASLRKKMKAMEEEFEQKLSQALENPVASSDALNHEREVIRAEMEKQWNDKILERTSIIKNQQEQINELEKKLEENANTIQLLQTQLSAATSGDDSGASSATNAKAAEAYVRFTAELRSISESAQRTLASIEQIWSGELDISAVQTAMPATPASTVKRSNPAVAAPMSATENKSEYTAADNDFDFGSLLVEDSTESVVSEISSNYEVDVPVKSAPVAPAAAKTEYSDDFASLLADSDDNTDNEAIFDTTATAAQKGEDLDAELLSDIVISPGEQSAGEDLGKMLEEKEQNEFDAFKDLFVTDSTADDNDNDFIDLTIKPISEAEKKPGVASEFDLTFDDDTPKGLEAYITDIDAPATEIKAESKPMPAPPARNKEEDLFDFSFLAADDDDEDDMSSDASFNGML